VVIARKVRWPDESRNQSSGSGAARASASAARSQVRTATGERQASGATMVSPEKSTRHGRPRTRVRQTLKVENPTSAPASVRISIA